jgi:hypothetical protein
METGEGIVRRVVRPIQTSPSGHTDAMAVAEKCGILLRYSAPLRSTLRIWDLDNDYSRMTGL